MEDITQCIRSRFGDIAPSELAEILQIPVVESRYMESGADLVYMDQKPIIFLGWNIDMSFKQSLIEREIVKYLKVNPEYLEVWLNN
ncbi:hypothetical protein [Listeria monocytogenes]|uniref:hypothetical protein n=1 Tax=Listeria monocytogenes TaxID=1639 RepID=UPI0011EB5B0D|nr:hypothetical protein [Listeria monocytogenes]TYV00344.1 hypothetical protein FZ054_15925 [Listeria monocytogenes]